LTFLVLSCSSKEELYDRITKIDAHVHIRTGDPSIMELAKSEGFKFLTINTRSSSQEYIDLQMRYAKGMAEQYPDRLSFIATFSMEGFEEPGWADRVIRKLENDFKDGAIGVKVWKDIGMTFRDTLDNFVFIDDPLFEPILDFISRSGKPVIAHIGEPRNCWLPIDSMTVNNDKNYFRNNPQYHMYLHPDYPSHERLMESRDHVLARYPQLKLVGAHLGSLEWDVDVLAERLDRYPNFAVDMAARVCHLQVQDSEKVRKFIARYQDRLLYATDLGVSESTDMEQRMKQIREAWRADWEYFASDRTLSSPNVEGEFRGLDLDRRILGKIFYSNALKWYPGIVE
jgi:predicted TIM-barrel fold metal-dependent hydrolase